jgi:hypothetical protein
MAIANSGQNDSTLPNAMPVAIMEIDASSRIRCRPRRLARSPPAKVSAADPNNVAVAMMPMANGLNPRAPR